MKSSKIVTAILTLILTPLLSYAQTNNMVQEDEWYEGAIYDYNNVKKSGYINFNYALNSIKFKKNNVEKVFTPTNTSSFDLIINGTKRSFYTFPYKNSKSGKTQKFFFELVHRNNKYMVLSKHQLEFWDATDTNFTGLKHTKSSYPNNSSYDEDDPLDLFHKDRRKEVVTEILFIANMQLEITPYLFTHKEKKRVLSEKKATKKIEKEKLISSALTSEGEKYHKVRKTDLEDFFKRDYNAFNRFVEQQNIDIETKEGFLKAIDFTNQ